MMSPPKRGSVYDESSEDEILESEQFSSADASTTFREDTSCSNVLRDGGMIRVGWNWVPSRFSLEISSVA